MTTIISAVLGGFPQPPHDSARTLHCNIVRIDERETAGRISEEVEERNAYQR